jgi:hypothetical protein
MPRWSVGGPFLAELLAVAGHDVLADLGRAVLSVERRADEVEHRARGGHAQERGFLLYS